MPRPPVEVADIIRAAGESFFEDSRKWLTWLHLKVLNAILRCRTAALGGHVDACSKCGHEAISFNSCRNRHCPKCQANARDRWLEARGKELLPTRYVHVVFTLPRHLSLLALQNKREIYALLFRASAETLLEIARDPKHLGAEIGFFSVLHGPFAVDRLTAEVLSASGCAQRSVPRQVHRGTARATCGGQTRFP
jgi:predicted Zn-ribbon and HTH transcriptional regulator